MAYYEFILDNDSGREELGGMEMTGDAEAIGFANQVIHDLKSQADRHARWSMGIIASERVVGTIQFELAPIEKQSD